MIDQKGHWFLRLELGQVLLFHKLNQRLNVNRGFGYLAYPGRVGIWPEVTVITLNRAKTSI